MSFLYFALGYLFGLATFGILLAIIVYLSKRERKVSKL